MFTDKKTDHWSWDFNVPVTMGLISLCWVVFFVMQLGGEDFQRYVITYWGVMPYAIMVAGPLHIFHELITFVTCIFIHGSFSHVANNTVWLLFIGIFLEPVLGKFDFLKVFFMTAFIGVVAFIIRTPLELSLSPLVGASGAVAGLLGVFVIRSWHYRHEPFSVARIILLFWFAMWAYRQIIGLAGVGDQHVGYVVHVGGFLAGWAWYWNKFMRVRKT